MQHDETVFDEFELSYEKETHFHSVTNNGHSIQYNFDSQKNKIKYKGQDYSLIQFHFHSPSEHTIDGVRYPLEIHLVHYNDSINQYLVVSSLAKEGEVNEGLEFIETFLPVEVGETKVIPYTHYFKNLFLLKDSMQVFRYEGSLTTPPCSENVSWFVYEAPLTVSKEQIEMLGKLMPKDNYRDTQPLNDRVVFSSLLTE